MISWRDSINVHPATSLFPRLDPDQLAELADDIRMNGLLHPVVYYKDDAGAEVFCDGCSRLDALEELGLVKIADGEISVEGYPDGAWKREDARASADPVGYVISANIRRRHLTGKQKRELIGKLVKADPAKSNRQISEMVGRDHKTVAVVRHELEGRGEIPHIEVVADTKGRRQPVHRIASRTTLSGRRTSIASRSTLKRVQNSQADKILKMTTAIHSLAGYGLDVKPQDLLSACDSEARRTDALGSARQARGWLNILLVDPAPHHQLPHLQTKAGV